MYRPKTSLRRIRAALTSESLAEGFNHQSQRVGDVMTTPRVPSIEEALRTHHPPIVRRPDEVEATMGRFSNTTQMAFHPTAEDPTTPNAGIVNYGPGGGLPLHMHDFAQLWYVLDGDCRFGDRTLTAGDLVYMQDPHFEHELHTENGCRILFLQYPGPTTGQGPIFEGRFDVEVANATEQENLRR